MANNYYDGTGTLVLDDVTPVIKALFGPFNLDESFPGNGEVYVAHLADNGDPTWDSISENLQELAADLGLQFPDQIEPTIKDCLCFLGAHFKSDHEAITSVIQGLDFEYAPSLYDMVDLAMCLDDGHGLDAFKFEGSWHCSRPYLFEFGGHGVYQSQRFFLDNASRATVLFGEQLDAALKMGDTDSAANCLVDEVSRILGGVQNDGVRDLLRKKVGQSLLSPREAAGEPKLFWFAVTGRVPGDDEDVSHIFNVATAAEALRLFDEAMYGDEEDPEVARENVHKVHGAHVFVNSLVMSDSPISDVEPTHKWTNYYLCACGTEWVERWSCCCNDDCPACGNKEIEPYVSDDGSLSSTDIEAAKDALMAYRSSNQLSGVSL